MDESVPQDPSTPKVPHVLEVEGVAVRYGAIHAVKRISLHVGQGEMVALVGANEAGKTSTLRAISGMIKAAAGTVRLNGVDITALPAHARVPLGMAHAPEGRGIFPNLTVRENLELGAYLRRDRAGIESDLALAFSRFPILSSRQHAAAGTLSGGEQQMLSISRALMSRPTLLLLDEPSLGLAPQVTQTIFRMLKSINSDGTSILLVEQNAHLALGMSHRAYVLETGEVVMEGPGRELLASDDIRRAYLGEL